MAEGVSTECFLRCVLIDSRCHSRDWIDSSIWLLLIDNLWKEIQISWKREEKRSFVYLVIYLSNYFYQSHTNTQTHRSLFKDQRVFFLRIPFIYFSRPHSTTFPFNLNIYEQETPTTKMIQNVTKEILNKKISFVFNQNVWCPPP